MIQFRVSRLFGLRVDADGMLIPGEQGLQLVFHRPDGDQGLLDANIQTVTIPWGDLESWEVDYGLLGDRVSLRVTSVECLRDLPGVDDCQVDLVIHKQQREALKDFEQRAREYEIGNRVDNVDEMIDEIRDFLQDM